MHGLKDTIAKTVKKIIYGHEPSLRSVTTQQHVISHPVTSKTSSLVSRKLHASASHKAMTSVCNYPIKCVYINVVIACAKKADFKESSQKIGLYSAYLINIYFL